MSIDQQTDSQWRRFWAAGGTWRALALVVGYLIIYVGVGKVIDLVFSSQVESDDVLGSVASVLLGLALPILIGIGVLWYFARSVGTPRDLFRRQPIGGRWWMWILPVVVLAVNILRFAVSDYSKYTGAVVVAVLVTGLCIGVAEETLTRGYVVNMLRRGGSGELMVALVSSLFFALSHTLNLIGGMAISTVALTVVYTFAFGVAMYCTLRVTRNLIWPILLHASTDPAGLLLSGGVDTVKGASHADGLTSLANAGNVFVIVIGFIVVWFVRGKVGKDAVGPEPTVANSATS